MLLSADFVVHIACLPRASAAVNTASTHVSTQQAKATRQLQQRPQQRQQQRQGQQQQQQQDGQLLRGFPPSSMLPPAATAAAAAAAVALALAVVSTAHGGGAQRGTRVDSQLPMQEPVPEAGAGNTELVQAQAAVAARTAAA
eukprot:351223-Chlamydomonas_euryale.AAC.1